LESPGEYKRNLENTGDAKKIQENFGKSRRIPYIYEGHSISNVPDPFPIAGD